MAPSHGFAAASHREAALPRGETAFERSGRRAIRPWWGDAGPRRPLCRLTQSRCRCGGCEAAGELVRRIRDYWQGHDVSVWIEKVVEHGGLLQIRSDMIGGLPRG